MTDPFEEHVARIGTPRPLDPEFRARLEGSIAESTDADPTTRWRIDQPRELTPPFRARLESGLTSRTARLRTPRRGVAAAIALVIAAGATVAVVDRFGAPDRPAAISGPVVSSQSPQPSPAGRPKGSLQTFASSGAFLKYVRGEGLKLAGPFGVSGAGMYGGFRGRITPTGVPGEVSQPTEPLSLTGQAPVPGSAPDGVASGRSYSSTNIQEEGVDEPDLVKTDGRRLIVMSGDQIHVLDVNEGTARIQGTLQIRNGVGLFLLGDKVIHFASLGQAPPEASRATHARERPWTKVAVIDIAEPSSPKVVSSVAVEGFFVGARLARGVVRLTLQSGALGPPPVALGRGQITERRLDAAEAKNKIAVRTSSVGDWVPHYVVRRSGRAALTGHVHDWAAVSRPPDRAGLSMLTIVTIDPDDPRPDNAASVIGAGEIIYSSLDNLYVTSSRLDDMLAIRRGRTPRAPITRIHKFDVRNPTRAIYRGSGEVPGHLLNQFSMSEHDGYLRVATTLDAPMRASGQGASRSSVLVLREKAGKLITVGSVGNLGVGERIFSVRFIGTKAYVVTFRRLDPLFVIDLGIPTRPRLRGKLKVPGYSGYLHPVSDTLLMGVGRDADARGVAKGLQLSLFDVSDAAHPRRLDALVVGANGSSEVESDHHSFLYWTPRRLAVVPTEIYDDDYSNSFRGALALTISGTSGFGKPVRVSHEGRPNTENTDLAIRRSLVIGDRLLTISDGGVLLSDLATLAVRSWIPFQD